MRKTMLALALVLAATPAFALDYSKPFKIAGLCFKKGERVSGMNKICYYDCLGSLTAINVKSFELCPLTIDD